MTIEKFTGTPAVFSQVVSLTDAEIKALNTTPIELIAAPGVGKFLVLEDISAKNEFGAAAFVLGGAVEARYTNGVGAKVSDDLDEVAWAEAAADAYQVVKGVKAVMVENAAIVLFAAVSDPTTGDGVWKLKVSWRIENTY